MSGIFRKCKYGGHFTKHLKKILLSLLGIITLGLINFSSAATSLTLTDEMVDWLNEYSINHGNNLNSSVINLFDYGNEIDGDFRNLCVVISGFSRTSDFSWRLDFTSSLNIASNGPYYGLDNVSLLCASGRRRYFLLRSTSTNNKFTIGEFWTIPAERLFYLMPYEGLYDTCDSDLNTCQSDLTTCQNSSCQSELVQCQNDYTTCENSLGQCGTSLNSCNNALGSCMQGNIGTGEYNWSALFINNIQHIGAPIINITIPEEIARDYTGNENSFDLVVDGYGYDEEKMLNMINTQNYKPTSEEMASLVGKFADFVPLLGVCILFLFIRYIIKKVFRF